jgi:hypothetical protein
MKSLPYGHEYQRAKKQKPPTLVHNSYDRTKPFKGVFQSLYPRTENYHGMSIGAFAFSRADIYPVD